MAEDVPKDKNIHGFKILEDDRIKNTPPIKNGNE